MLTVIVKSWCAVSENPVNSIKENRIWADSMVFLADSVQNI